MSAAAVTNEHLRPAGPADSRGHAKPRSVIVAGGGIAGIAAALRLAEAGVSVTLLETRKKLGGRATSFVDPRTGETLDNCQHVVMGCCTAYLDLLARLNALDQIEWTREQYWIEPGGRESIVRPAPIPAPLHFAISVATAKFLTLSEKAAMAWGAQCIAHADRSAWRDRTFADFLAKARQPAGLIRKFWAPVVVSACNLPCERVCAASALHVFQDGFFGSPRAAEIGVSRVPLLRLYDRAEQAIAAAGGLIRLGFSVDHLDARTVRGTSAGKPETLSADAVICALPIDRALDVIDPEILRTDLRFARDASAPSTPDHAANAGWSFSPILGVHLAFDRPVLTRPHCVLVPATDGLETQWLFRKDSEGRKLHAVISAADEWMDLSEAQIGEKVAADIRAHLPASRDAKLVSVRSVKEKRATFAGTPRVEKLRPAPTGPSGLILAGDATTTGWPATMEGATRSGYVAAAAAIDPASDPRSAIPPELKRGILARVLVR